MRHRTAWGLAAGLLLTAGLAQAQTAATPDPAYLPYVKPGRLAEVAPGRKIDLICMGQGAPTVIFTAGLGDWAATWMKVQPTIARKTRTCAWDRAGYGFSSPSPEPQDVVHTSADLDTALRAAGETGPYVLVGHSLGGYESLLFADGHPRDVVGLVLVDPSVPDQHRIMSDISAESARFEDRYMAAAVDGLRACAAALRSGAAKVGDARLTPCVDDRPAYPPELKANLAAMTGDPDRYETQASLAEHFSDDAVAVLQPGRRYGALPLIVLTAGEEQKLPAELHLPPATLAALTEFHAKAWPRAHDALAALSSRGRNITVPDSSHYIQQIRPQAVIDAIDEVVDAARKR